MDRESSGDSQGGTTRWQLVRTAKVEGKKGDSFLRPNSSFARVGGIALQSIKAAKDMSRCVGSVTLDLFDCETAAATRDCILKSMKDLATDTLGLGLVKTQAADGPAADTTDNLPDMDDDTTDALPDLDEDVEEANMDDDLRELLNSVPITVVRVGDVILRAGELSRSIFIIVSGSVEMRSHKGEILVRREAGEVVGEVAFYSFGNGGAGCDVVASSDVTTIRVMSGDVLDGWRVEEPIKAALINRFLARCMSARVQRQVQDAVMFLDT